MAIAMPAIAQITPDGTLGRDRSIVSPNTPIRGRSGTLIEGGARRGSTLFQSFSEFQVGEGQRVYFANPNRITTILTRITGNDPSRILGTLGVDGRANLVFLNPNGILFGANARLDISGSFTASTSDRLDLGNGLTYSAVDPKAPPVLTVSLRPGLQLGRPIGDIRSEGSLTVGTGQTLTLHGNQVAVSGALTVPDGTVQVLGNQVQLDAAQLDVSGTTFGTIRLAAIDHVDIINGSRLDARSSSPTSSDFSTIQVSGNTVNIDASYLSTTNLSTGRAGDIALTARDRLDIRNSRGLTSRPALGLFSRGSRGRILIGESTYFTNSPAIVHLDNSQLGTDNDTPGAGTLNAGSISIRALEAIQLQNNAIVGSSTFRAGAAGAVRLKTPGQVTLATASRIFSTAERNAVGNAGGVAIEAGSIQLDDASSISTSTFSRGNAGLVVLKASDRLSLLNGSAIFSRATSGSQGNPGGVAIEAGSFEMRDDSSISTSTFTRTRSTSAVSRLNDLPRSLIGSIYLLIENDAELNNSNIFNNLETGASGRAGLIVLLAESLELRRGSQIQTLVRGEQNGQPAANGRAGNILVQVENGIKITGRDSGGFPSAIFSQVGTGSQGTAGNLFVQANSVQVRDRGKLDVNNLGSGGAGSVFLFAKGIWLDQESRITGITASGQSGNVILNVPGAIILGRDSNIFTDNINAQPAARNQSAGNIAIGTGQLIEGLEFTEPVFLVAGKTVNNNNIFSRAERGSGGIITVNALRLQDIASTRTPSPETNDISTDSRFGVDGTTVVKTLDVDPARGVVPLPNAYEEPRIAQGCDPRDRAGTSQFVITGQGGLPTDPTAAQLSPPIAANWEELPATMPRQAIAPDTVPPLPAPSEMIVAQGFSVAPNGEIILVGDAANVQPQAPWSPSPACRGR
jgi:filamentous hemagglutinin family protein